MRAGARPEVNDMVRAPHGRLVMFDDDHRIAAISERYERVKQLFVVARVQADGRLIQNIKHAAEVGTELRRQADTLGFAARKRGNASAQLQIAQADLRQEFQTLANLRQNIPRDDGGAALELHPFEKIRRRTHRHLRKVVNGRRAFGDGEVNGPRDGVQPRPAAVRADFAIALLPAIPRFLNGVGARAAIHLGQVKQFPETPAFRAPALGGIVAEKFRVERLNGTAAFRTRALGGMHRDAAVVVQREHGAPTKLQGFVNQGLRGLAATT